jgi:hypothetical protein
VPAACEPTGVERVVAERVEQLGDALLPRGILSRDRERAPLGGPGRSCAVAQAREGDVVEGLDDVGAREVGLDELARGRGLVVERCDLPVALGVVVGRVDDDLACEVVGGEIGVGDEGIAPEPMMPSGAVMWWFRP